MTEWKMVKVYECPVCGALCRDMDDALCHECHTTTMGKETEFVEQFESNTGGKENGIP